MNVYQQINALLSEDPDEAHRRCRELLDSDPDDAQALFLMGVVESRAERYGVAYNLFKRVADLKPSRAEAWNNVGMALEGLHKPERAREAFLEAWKRDKRVANYPANVALTYMEQRNYKEALKWCQTAFQLDPEHSGTKTTWGMCNLALGNWKDGWAGMAHSLGGKFRKEVVYGDEVRWTGEKGQSVVFYGEQGIGDEVMYASCLPDAIEHCEKVIVECDPRLEGLYRRSFPKAHVYGTRRVNEIEWPARHRIDARCPVGQLPQFFRESPQSCPGTPYLVADPERRVQWRALFDSWGKKPKIGLAWSGGSRHNSPEARSIGLEGLRPLIEALDADWICLQYKDAQEEIERSGLPVRQYPRATLTSDYDDTAGLVAELDLVVSVPTSVIHLAGALGVKVHCLTPEQMDWNFRADKLPWYGSVELFKKRNGESWSSLLERYIQSFHRV